MAWYTHIPGSTIIYEFQTNTQLGINQYNYKNAKREIQMNLNEIDKETSNDPAIFFTTIEISQYNPADPYWQYELNRGAERTFHSQHYKTFEEAELDAIKHMLEADTNELEELLLEEAQRRIKECQNNTPKLI